MIRKMFAFVLFALLLNSESSVRAQAGRAIEKGSQAEARVLAGGSVDPQRAAAYRAAREREKAARSLSEEDRKLVNAAIETLRAKYHGSLSFKYAETPDRARVGSVFRIRSYQFQDEDGVKKAVRPTAHIVSTKDETNAIVEYHPGGSDDENRIKYSEFWLRGVNLRKRKVGDSVPLNGVFAVTGSEKNDAANHQSRAVPRLELIDVNLHAKDLEQQASEKGEHKIAVAIPEANFRKWTNSSANHSVEALLISYSDGFIMLEKRDGTKVKVDVTKLSEVDQAYVNSWRQKH
jgi:SLA1 homology domain 1, SHD1